MLNVPRAFKETDDFCTSTVFAFIGNEIVFVSILLLMVGSVM